MLVGAIFFFLLPAAASAQSVTKGYGSDQTLQRGMVVGIKKTDANKVETITVQELSRVLGVVVNPNDSPITISNQTQRVFVAFTGKYDVLVSDQEGEIVINDYITVSSVGGIGMRATSDQDMIVGRASAAFDGKSKIVSTLSLKTNDGKTRSVHVGRIPVEIAIGKNPIAKKADNAPAFLAKIGRAIAGKQVSAIRLYLSAATLMIGTLVAGALLYGGISSGIISIGRNPLGRNSIIKSVLGVAVTSVLVFLISMLGVYLLLKL